MSDGLAMQLGEPHPDGFSVRVVCGCRVVFGMIPASEFAMLAHGYSKKALMATDIADRIGATVVIGEPADLDELRKLELPVSDKRLRDYALAMSRGLEAVALWLRDGERGSPSNAMCKQLFGVPESAGLDHPLDPDDLRRCLLFIDAVGVHDRVNEMACVSVAWSCLVGVWPDLVRSFEQEVAAGKSARQTYALMQDALAREGR